MAICARNVEELETARAELAAFGPIYAEALDMANSEAVYAFADHVVAQFGRLDCYMTATTIEVSGGRSMTLNPTYAFDKLAATQS